MTTTKTIQQVNKEILQNGIGQFLQGNIQAVLDACTDDVEWATWDNPAIPFARTYKGKQGVATFFQSLMEAADFKVFEPKGYYADGDKVFAVIHQQAIIRKTGKQYDHPFIFEVTFENEKMKKTFSYVNSIDQANAFSETDLNKMTVCRFNKEFIEGGDEKAFNEIMSPEFINRTAPPGVPPGPEGVLFFFNQFLKPAFSGLTVEILQQTAEGDTVTTHKKFYATHTGEFMGVPPTGNKVVMEVMDILRLKEGRFTEHWNVVDWADIMRQLKN